MFNMHQKESMEASLKPKGIQKPAVQSHQECEKQDQPDPRVEAFVTELIGRVADKWTMMIIEVLTEPRRGPIHPAQ